MNAPMERDHLGKALDISVRLSVIALIVLGAYRIFSPFLMVVAWGVIIATTVQPLYDKLRRALGGRRKLAASAFVAVSLALVLVPTTLLMDSLIDGAVHVVESLKADTVHVPPPPEHLQEWPVIGERLYTAWHSAAMNMGDTLQKLAPQLAEFGSKLARAFGSLGGALLQTLFGLIIAGILLSTSEGGSRAAQAIAVRLAGKDGPAMVTLAVGTIRSVVKGVILVALIQGILAAIGLGIARVPGVGLWSLLVMVVAVIQLPPLLVLLPIAVWVFLAKSTGMAVFFVIWSVIVSASDSFLKPIFLGRGVQVPMLVILVGAIGGMLRSGIIGLFIGPVVLAIGYQLFMAWVREDATPSVGMVSSGPASGSAPGDVPS